MLLTPNPLASITALNKLYLVLCLRGFLPFQIVKAFSPFYFQFLRYPCRKVLMHMRLPEFLASFFCFFKEAFDTTSSLSATSSFRFFAGTFVWFFETHVPTATNHHLLLCLHVLFYNIHAKMILTLYESIFCKIKCFLRRNQSVLLCFFFFRFCCFLVTPHLCLETHYFSNYFKRCKRINKITFLISSSFSSVSFFVFLRAAFFFFTYIILKKNSNNTV